MLPTCFAVEGEPCRKGTTPAAADLADPLVGSAMSARAVIVVPSTVPSTRTFSPFLTDADETAFLTVTFCPAGVVSVKLDADALSTVPIVPPAAGPERALDAPPRDPGGDAAAPLAMP